MLTRREVLTGVAAASIAAIASARDSAMAQADSDGGFGCGDVKAESALASFHKLDTGFDVFLKLEDTAAEVFFKELPGGGVEAFLKSFHKGWTPLTSVFLKLNSLDGTKGFFDFNSAGAEFFLKTDNQVVVDATFNKSSDIPFLKIEIKEVIIST